MTEANFGSSKDLDLPGEFFRVPEIVLIAEGKKVGVGPTCVERCPKAASEICVDANTGVVFEEVDQSVGEASDRVANVLIRWPVG